MIQTLLSIVIAFSVFTSNAHALKDADLLSTQIKKTLIEKFPNSEIRLPNLDKLATSPEVSSIREIVQIRVVEERSNGVAVLELIGTDGENVRIQTPFQALMKAPIAIHRIYPNSKIKKEDIKIDVLNVAMSPAKEYRGAIIFDEKKIENSEAKQTILEGQFIVSSAIQRTPDLRKGEMVRLEMSSGELSLTTAATVLENASIGENVHVLTAKTKKEVMGKVRADHSVEVNL